MRAASDLLAQTGVNIAPIALDTTIAHSYTAPQTVTPAALTDAATIAWNAGAIQNATVTLGANRTMAAPTNQIAGAIYTLRVIQDATGSRTLTWNAAFKSAANSANAFAPTLSTAAASSTVLTFISDGTNMLGFGGGV